ncbi:MAG TPA: PRC-barrel domain-containing protein [Acidimicrobiia bacterium]|nr:PRC-barrel domain-containing protein [Acidimicrobiia bacterium]
MPRAIIGEKLVDKHGNPVGKITDVIVDSATLENEWLTVKTGMMGGEHLVPYVAVEEQGGEIAVPFAKDDIKSAPAPDKGHAAPSPSEREQVFSHFGMTDPGPPARFGS